jgi:hypothetical protein
MRDVSMSPKVQQERGIKPLAPLTYTPAGVQTYGPRPGYTPPKAGGKANPSVYDTEDMEAGQAAAANQAGADQAAFERLIQEKQNQPMKEEVATKEEAKEPSSMDEYLKMLKGGYEDIKKQKEEDKYLALLAAGLGMMGGTSPFAAANIGQGGLHGLQSLATASKESGAEKSALDRAYGQALYRKGIGESTEAYKKGMLANREATLELAQKEEMDKVLMNMERRAADVAKQALTANKFINADTPQEEIAAKVASMARAELANNPAYSQVYKQRWGMPLELPKSTADYSGFKLVKS